MKNIIAISDVSLGYGSSQVPNFIKYLLTQYDNCSAKVIEPDQPEKPYVKNRYPEFEIIRILTTENVYSKFGRIEYLNKAVSVIDKLKPDIFVVFCTFTLPVIMYLKVRPLFTIYYNIETASFYGSRDDILNSNLEDKIDLLIYPEKNRAMFDIFKYNYSNIPTVIVCNTDGYENSQSEFDFNKGNRCIIYQGTIDALNTNARYFLDDKLEKYRIDIYGNFAGSEALELQREFARLNGRVRYLGYVENHILREIRKNYAYSIVMWAPVNENQYFAAPNKFFESLLDGVPPIVAPHPQCKYFVEKYNCGILMDDWTKESMIKAIDIAMKIYDTDMYEEMVRNCFKAVEKETNWQKQMQKVKPYLIKL